MACQSKHGSCAVLSKKQTVRRKGVLQSLEVDVVGSANPFPWGEPELMGSLIFIKCCQTADEEPWCCRFCGCNYSD